MLQLVQALRYEGGTDAASSVATDTAEEAAQAVAEEPVAVAHSHLSRFLVSRAMQSFELANYLYWYLKVELSTGPEGQTTAYPIYRRVFQLFEQTMQTSERGITIFLKIQRQDQFISRVARCHVRAKDEGRRKDARAASPAAEEEQLSSWLVPPTAGPAAHGDGCARREKMFKSAVPAVWKLKTAPHGDPAGAPPSRRRQERRRGEARRR